MEISRHCVTVPPQRVTIGRADEQRGEPAFAIAFNATDDEAVRAR
jgi:hypothetical protein